MRVVPAEPTRRQRWPLATTGTSRAAHLERLGLAMTSLVLLLGLWLTYSAQTAEFHSASRDLASGRLSNLNAARGNSEPLEHVGGLATLRGMTTAEIAALKPRVVVRTPREYRQRVLIAVSLFMLSFWIAHAVRAYFRTTGDAVLLPAIHLLTGLGLMAMLALRDPLRDMVLAGAVAQGVAAGCLLWTVLSFIDFENPQLRRAVLAPLAAAVLLAATLLVFGSGPTGSGAKVNLLGAQPVEAIRLLVVFSLAAYFARRWQFLREFSTSIKRRDSSPALPVLGRLDGRLDGRLGGRDFSPAGPAGPAGPARQHALKLSGRLPRWKDVRPLVVSITALLTLFFLQRDLGPALVMACVFLGLYGISRAHVALVLCGFAVLTAGFAVGYVLGIPATVTRRVAIALDPWDNALAGGDQIAHALWAMASGGRWGLGPGVGDPQVIPAGHTDLILAGLGEELGIIGFVAILGVFAIVVWRLLRISLRAPGDYTMFLTLALTLGLVAQGFVIVAGMLGLLPLAGVVTPFLSYGRSAMLSNFVALGVCAAIARRRGTQRESFEKPIRTLGWTMACAAAIVLFRAVDVQAARPDVFATRPNLTQQADGGYRYQYNPRLAMAAREIVRGTIYDRTGLPVATSRPDDLTKFAERFRTLGIVMPADCRAEQSRCYPLGGLAFHVLGDAAQETNWAARNVSYIEQDFDAHLQGFDDKPTAIDITNSRTGRDQVVLRRDFRQLLPLVRHKGNRGHRDVRRLLARDRDLRISLDAGLQMQAAQILRVHTQRAGSTHGAAIVLDPATGELLASASYPWPDDKQMRGEAPVPPDVLLDRARYGLYPPGSTFKLVTAVAALRADPASQHSTFQCVRLPDGRVGGRVRGAARPIRDDPLDDHPHGTVDLHRGLVVSCNAYFSHLADRIGPGALGDAAAAAQIAPARPPVAENLRRTLPYAGYGQGDVLASPLRMARVAAALAAGGVLRDVRVRPVSKSRNEPSTDARWLRADGAARLRQYMREAVTSGTGRVLATHPVPIAGKTGTAEVDDARSHSWFVGFAPFDSASSSARAASAGAPRRIAFAVIVENAGYGARFAAPIAGGIVSAAQARGLIP